MHGVLSNIEIIKSSNNLNKYMLSYAASSKGVYMHYIICVFFFLCLLYGAYPVNSRDSLVFSNHQLKELRNMAFLVSSQVMDY